MISNPIPTIRYVNIFSFDNSLKKKIIDKAKVFFDTVFQVLFPPGKTLPCISCHI